MVEVRKLQEMTRTRDTIPFIYLPQDMVQMLRWKKGDDINFEIKEGKLILRK